MLRDIIDQDRLLGFDGETSHAQFRVMHLGIVDRLVGDKVLLMVVVE
jgi:hypothetical protein